MNGMQDYLINRLLVAIAPFYDARGTWLRIRLLPCQITDNCRMFMVFLRGNGSALFTL